tara:strand:+ start:65 stop:1129 length:1065 start_codon:yes stop_codon:yes gene_type:complete
MIATKEKLEKLVNDNAFIVPNNKYCKGLVVHGAKIYEPKSLTRRNEQGKLENTRPIQPNLVQGFQTKIQNNEFNTTKYLGTTVYHPEYKLGQDKKILIPTGNHKHLAMIGEKIPYGVYIEISFKDAKDSEGIMQSAAYWEWTWKSLENAQITQDFVGSKRTAQEIANTVAQSIRDGVIKDDANQIEKMLINMKVVKDNRDIITSLVKKELGTDGDIPEIYTHAQVEDIVKSKYGENTYFSSKENIHKNSDGKIHIVSGHKKPKDRDFDSRVLLTLASAYKKYPNINPKDILIHGHVQSVKKDKIKLTRKNKVKNLKEKIETLRALVNAYDNGRVELEDMYKWADQLDDEVNKDV